jgi:uncharacterized protein (TIGR03086 family)
VDERDVFVLADQALNRVISQVRDDQWQMEIPPDFLRHPTPHTPTLREILDYHAYDEAWVPDMLAGRTMDEVGATKYDGNLLGDDPRASYAALMEKACAAARELDDLDRVVHCSFGDYPAREYLWQVAGFRGLRANDIAKVIGVDPTLPDELVQGLWDIISPHVEEWRAIGVFPSAVPVPPEAPLQDRLLGITGRQPNTK